MIFRGFYLPFGVVAFMLNMSSLQITCPCTVSEGSNSRLGQQRELTLTVASVNALLIWRNSV